MVPEEFLTGDEGARREPYGARVGRDKNRISVWLWGEHDLATVGLLSTALIEAIAVDHGDVVVDLGEVGFMDASTLGVLVRERDLLGARGRRLTVRSPQRGPRKVLELCDLTELIEDPPAGATPGDSARTALETWVEVPAAGLPTESSQPARRDTARDDPEASRQ